MHKTIANNLTVNLKAAISALNNDPFAMRKIFNEIHKVLWETFKTKIYFITPGCSTCEYVLVDKAYKDVMEKIRSEFSQSYNSYRWSHLDENLFHQALDRLIYNIHDSLTYNTPAEVYICCSQPSVSEDSYYYAEWFGKCRYGLYVQVKQINETVEEFDLLETYRYLENI